MERKEYIEELNKELKESLQELNEQDFKCYMVKKGLIGGPKWGWIITPNDNIIYVQRSEFIYQGWVFTFEYVPSRETGTGCRASDEAVSEITAETVLEAEKEGYKYAKQLKAKFYKNSEEWLANYWDKDNLEEI